MLRQIIAILIMLGATTIFAQQNISDVRQLREGETATFSGIIINGNELGAIRYIQDSTAGLAIYDSKLNDVKRGDSITVTGEVSGYNNLFEIKNVSSLTVNSSGNQLPTSKVLAINQIGEAYEGQLIRIDNIEFENANGTFSGNRNYTFTDGTNSGEIRISSSSPIVGQGIPTGKINVIAICSQYSYTDNDTQNGYQLIPREMEDFVSGSAINITSPITVSSISKTGFTLTWSTDVGGSSEVVYGTNDTLKSWTDFATGSTNAMGNLHHVTLSGLNPATIVYAKVFSVLDNDTAFSSVGVYCTQSNSSGKIKAYFNTQVNTSLATEKEAKNIGNAMEDTLIAYINRARETIDFCIYNINNSGLSNVSEALNSAHNRGVRVRFITSGSTSHSGVDDLIDAIPVIESPVFQNSGIMHNKFVIFDAQSTNAAQPWVWSGSTNLTYDQIESDANNMVFIQDQSLAKAYEIEFEEMWGGADDLPNSGESRFGAAKTDNTPHEFQVGNSRVELYFSPSDGTNQKIIKAINSADNDLNVETMVITRSDIANAISAAKSRGVEVQVLTNSKNDNTEFVNTILSSALPDGKFIFDNKAKATLHHKLAIVDANRAASDPQVITGSHNWSNSANNKNDENTLIIHNAGVANQYFQQFGYRFVENGGDLTVSAKNIKIENIKVYPNPTIGEVSISSQKTLSRIVLFSSNGVIIKDIHLRNRREYRINLSNNTAGLYLLKVYSGDNSFNSYKIIKRK